MNDIEDCGKGSGVGAMGAQSKPTVIPRSRRTAAGRSAATVEDEDEDINNGFANLDQDGGTSTHLPGKGTVFVHTFGCGHNVSDGEYMAGQLANSGFSITDDFQGADCYVINSCTVKNPSEDHFVTMLKRARDTKKPVVVAGCVPQGDPKNKEWADVSVIGVRQIGQVTNAVEQAMSGNVVRYLNDDSVSRNAAKTHKSVESPLNSSVGGVSSSSSAGGNENKNDDDQLPPLDLPKIRRNKYIEIVPINVGCLNNCTYCKTKHARGDLRSWPIAEVVQRVRDVVAEGVREVRLTSEDTGAYGIDIGTNAVTLLEEVVKVVEGTTVMLRVGMSNPPYLIKQLEGFARVMAHPNVYEFLHLPVQSGSNAVLDEMKREYTVDEFLLCVNTLRGLLPNMSIATDIICSFPGEGEQEWQETMDLCKRVTFPILNISRFYARRGTPAAAMPQIPSHISKQRSVELTKFYNSYTTYDAMQGTTHTMVSLLELAHDKVHLVGHTKGYVQVLVHPSQASLGDCVDLTVVSTTKYSVTGNVIKNYGAVQRLPTTASATASKSTTSPVRGGTNINTKSSVQFVCGAVVAIAMVGLAVRYWRR